MNTQSLFNGLLFFAAISTTLVAGLTLTFAIVIMPGIKHLADDAFIRAFQVIDGIIQNGQPIFGFIWVGSILSVFGAACLGFWQVESWPKWLLLASAVIYFLGVQLPTFGINVPLNNQVQRLQIEQMDEAALASARQNFEATWNRWNLVRTYFALIVGMVLLSVIRLL